MKGHHGSMVTHWVRSKEFEFKFRSGNDLGLNTKQVWIINQSKKGEEI